jgi:hypothetical protein
MTTMESLSPSIVLVPLLIIIFSLTSWAIAKLQKVPQVKLWHLICIVVTDFILAFLAWKILPLIVPSEGIAQAAIAFLVLVAILLFVSFKLLKFFAPLITSSQTFLTVFLGAVIGVVLSEILYPIVSQAFS